MIAARYLRLPVTLAHPAGEHTLWSWLISSKCRRPATSLTRMGRPCHAPLMTTDKPYRANAGIALFNAAGLVLIGRRFRDDGPEIILPGLEWQMPQGGIDPDEDPRAAMMRELWEETGVSSAGYLGETGWLTYEFPPYAGPAHRLAKFRGQRQKWFALRFKGP